MLQPRILMARQMLCRRGIGLTRIQRASFHSTATPVNKRKDVRIAFLGDSFVNGAGDDDCLGWPGRLCADARQRFGQDVTMYNLGIRWDTSADILRRWEGEVDARLKTGEGYEGKLVFSFGVNDCVLEYWRRRVETEESVANARKILEVARKKWPTLMVGPPPSTSFGDEGFNERIKRMDEGLAKVCKQLDVPFLSVFEELRPHDVWCEEAKDGDGIHPNGGGYGVIYEALREWEAWQEWMPGVVH